MKTASDVWPGAHNGDGNGLVDAGNVAEIYYAFEHLADAGLIKGTYTGVGTAGAGTWNGKIGVNLPVGDVVGVTYMFSHPNQTDGVVSGDSFYQDGVYGHVLRVAAEPENTGSFPGTSFLTPKEAYQVDDKFDDGNPTTGWITVAKGLTSCFSGTTYTTTAANDAKNCWFILNMR